MRWAFAPRPATTACMPRGVLWGGNLTMLCSMLGTPHFPRVKGGILFIEDVNEHPYRVERCLLQLHQAGVLGAQKALLFGAVTDFTPSPLDRGYTLKSVIAHLRTVSRTPLAHRVAVRPRANEDELSGRPAASSLRCRGATCSSAGDADACARLAAGVALCRGAGGGTRGLQQQPVSRRAGGQQHADLHLRRALTPVPRPGGVVLPTRSRPTPTRSTNRPTAITT